MKKISEKKRKCFGVSTATKALFLSRGYCYDEKEKKFKRNLKKQYKQILVTEI